MRKTWRKPLSFMGVGILAIAASGRGDDKPGPIVSLSDLQDAGKILFKLADGNNDGQISQKEAIDAGNLMVGGFFFRADANGDGVLSKDEAKAAKDAFLSQQPLLRVFVEKNQNVQPTPGSAAANANQTFEALVDTNHDGNLQATEVRQLVTTTVTAIFASADTNRDGNLSPTEVNAAIIGAANAMANAAFQAADLDKNGQISQAEFDKAIIEPAHAIFRAMDLNNDGQISPEEARSAREAIMQQVKMLRVPEQPNSARNLINSGASPSQVAPVPRFNTTAPAPNAPPRQP
jgi:Ca2+-binding EF-hand superfamily protein